MLLAPSVQAEPQVPMYWRRRFRGETDQARVVRAFAGQLLAGFPALDDVLLVLNELVVNSLRHTRSGEDGGHFVVEISQDARVVLVSVTDEGGPNVPVLRAAHAPCMVDDLWESGRGLLTVEALAARWSWTGDVTGRTVHATFPVRL
jgi:anti-sigma regulatory factor (Ser/Thr protein kinase)